MEKTSPPSHHQSPHGPYGRVDRSEKEHRDLVALTFLLDVIFTDTKEKVLLVVIFSTETEIPELSTMTDAGTSRGKT